MAHGSHSLPPRHCHGHNGDRTSSAAVQLSGTCYLRPLLQSPAETGSGRQIAADRAVAAALHAAAHWRPFQWLAAASSRMIGRLRRRCTVTAAAASRLGVAMTAAGPRGTAAVRRESTVMLRSPADGRRRKQKQQQQQQQPQEQQQRWRMRPCIRPMPAAPQAEICTRPCRQRQRNYDAAAQMPDRRHRWLPWNSRRLRRPLPSAVRWAPKRSSGFPRCRCSTPPRTQRVLALARTLRRAWWGERRRLVDHSTARRSGLQRSAEVPQLPPPHLTAGQQRAPRTEVGSPCTACTAAVAAGGQPGVATAAAGVCSGAGHRCRASFGSCGAARRGLAVDLQPHTVRCKSSCMFFLHVCKERKKSVQKVLQCDWLSL